MNNKLNTKLQNFINESNAGDGSVLPVLGPSSDFDMFYNPRVVGNTLSSSPDRVTGINTEIIEDDYFKNNNRDKIKRNKKKKIKNFTEYKKEGAGFGVVDYRNVTGAGSGGYLNDRQPMGHNGSVNILSDIPRGNYHEPSTVVIGFKDHELEDPYFLKRKQKKKKLSRKSNWEEEILDDKVKKINRDLKKDLPQD